MKLAIYSAAILLTAVAAVADDWPQWRGPQRNGISKETGLLAEWPKDGPKLLWHVKEIGAGYSTPAVVGERLYLLSNKGLDNEFVQALSAKDGSPIWATTIGKVGNPEQNPAYPAARSTPTVDGDALYALGSDGDLACLAAADGKLRWAKNIRKEFGGKPGVWAFAESPLLDGDWVLCTPGGKDAAIVALNKKNGDVVWKAKVPENDEAGYASIIAIEAAGRKQYVQFMSKGLVGIDAKTGAFLWRYDQTGKSPANIPTPVAAEDFVYSAAGRTGGGLVKLKPQGDGIAADQVYFERGLPMNIGGSVLIGDYLYGTSSASGLVCVEFKTGKIKWQDKSLLNASLVYADGNLYQHGEDGGVALVAASPDGYRERGRFNPPDRPVKANRMERSWAYPVVAGGRLYLRDGASLWCYDVSGK